MNDQEKIFEERMTFLNDIVYYYGSDTKRRAMRGGDGWSRSGVYLEEKSGLSCAIGKHILPEKRSIFLRGSIRNLFLYDPKNNVDNKVDIIDFLPEKIYRLGIDFLSAVAGLHDGDKFWDDHVGLTWNGQEAYNEIIRTYCSKTFHPDDYIARKDNEC